MNTRWVTGSTAGAPLVVARRWDQLGGRISAMVNALSIAKQFGFQFRFVWPEGPDLFHDDLRQLFTEDFCMAHEISATEVGHRRGVPCHELAELDTPGAWRLVAESDDAAFVDVNEIFAVFRNLREPVGQAQARFRVSFSELGWSEEIDQLRDFVARRSGHEHCTAVHVRAGDIITGSWRHVLVHEKYSPTPYIHHALERLGREGRPVLLFSDNDDYQRWLCERYPGVTGAAEVLSGHPDLTPVQRALADILLMSRCELIVGPPSSAFSRLAVNLGSGELQRADQLVSPGHERDVLWSAICTNRKEGARPHFWDALEARDICWYLDVFSDEVPMAQQHELATRAARLDPGFVGALTRSVRIATLTGNERGVRAAAHRARRLAESAERHDDPMLEALSSEVALRCFELVVAEARWWRWGRRRTRALAAAQLELAEIRALFMRCLELRPIWSDGPRVREALDLLLSMVQEVLSAPPAVRRCAGRRMVRVAFDPLRMQRLRPGGLRQHRAVALFDPLQRDLERMTLHMYELLMDMHLPISSPPLAPLGTEA